MQQRSDDARVQTHVATMDGKQHSDEAAADARKKWAQMKADGPRHMDEARERLNKQGAHIDASVAESNPRLSELDASDAIDFAGWAIDNACLAMLSAIDARLTADELVATAARA